jgi:inorganic pyrophosphatase
MTENFKQWLGQEVDVEIDRPIGSAHPEFPNIIYPINYGHIPGTYSEIDHEEIDAYILGPEKPLQTFKGKVMAVIVRDDDEIKLIVTNGRRYTVEDIERTVFFQEKYYKHRIEEATN